MRTIIGLQARPRVVSMPPNGGSARKETQVTNAAAGRSVNGEHLAHGELTDVRDDRDTRTVQCRGPGGHGGDAALAADPQAWFRSRDWYRDQRGNFPLIGARHGAACGNGQVP